jgi:hypothetical protein
MTPFALCQSNKLECFNSEGSIAYQQVTIAVASSDNSSSIQTTAKEPLEPLSPLLLLPLLIGLAVRLLIQWVFTNPVQPTSQSSKPEHSGTQSVQKISNRSHYTHTNSLPRPAVNPLQHQLLGMLQGDRDAAIRLLRGGASHFLFCDCRE